jgi:hypothetical protein
MIDGVHFGEHVVLAAVRVDEPGDKQVLRLREGATGCVRNFVFESVVID